MSDPRSVPEGANISFAHIIAILASAPLLADAAAAADMAELAGRWVLESTGGALVTPGIYFEIAGERIEGFDGCNRFAGSLAGGPIVMGQRDCEGEAIRLPLDLVRPADHLRQADVAGDRLLLPLADGPGVAIFRRVAAENGQPAIK